MELAIISYLRTINRWIALGVGLGLVGVGAFVVLDILLRQFHTSLGGSEELAGYAMALASAWGMAYTLLELAHIRIDLVRAQTRGIFRALFDLLAMVTLAAVIVTVAYKCWPLVERAWVNDSRANTPLATPLIWVQLPWLLGWVWFAIASVVLTAASASLIFKGQFADADRAVGVFSEAESSL